MDEAARYRTRSMKRRTSFVRFVKRRRRNHLPSGEGGLHLPVTHPSHRCSTALARMGMINSPDRRADMTYLEEFMEQMADGRELYRLYSLVRRT